ncbi:MAG: hypothetical protein ACXWQO_02035, partial [Bdellovibrionota bacterium]
MKVRWTLILFVAGLGGAFAYANGSSGMDSFQNRFLGTVHKTLVGRLSTYSWFEKIDAFFELAADSLHARQALGNCGGVINPPKLEEEISAKDTRFPFFKLLKLERLNASTGLTCDSLDHLFSVAPLSDAPTLSISREWGEPMALYVDNGSVIVLSPALMLRWRYSGGEALLRSEGPVKLVIGHTSNVYSARIMLGKCELVSFKSIKGDSVVEPARLSANGSASWQLGNGKVLQQNETVDILPSGLDNWVKNSTAASIPV